MDGVDRCLVGTLSGLDGLGVCMGLELGTIPFDLAVKCTVVGLVLVNLVIEEAAHLTVSFPYLHDEGKAMVCGCWADRCITRCCFHHALRFLGQGGTRDFTS
jgi:hypothetical protein